MRINLSFTLNIFTDSNHGANMDSYSALPIPSDQSFVPYPVAKPIVAEFPGYTQPAPIVAPFNQPLDQILVNGKDSVEHQNGSYDQVAFVAQQPHSATAVVSQFGGAGVPNLWNANTWN